MQLTASKTKGVMMMTIGEYLKKYRAEHGLSQRQFAALCGVSNGYISMLETGVNTSTGQPIIPTLQTMRKISGAMGLTIHQVLSEVDDVVLDIGADEEKQPPAAGELSEDEVILLQAYRALPEHEKQNVLSLLRLAAGQAQGDQGGPG
jgi:transcriptional regulator with XRE-family HTH domain